MESKQLKIRKRGGRAICSSLPRSLPTLIAFITTHLCPALAHNPVVYLLCLTGQRSHRLKDSQCHTDTGVFEAHGEDALVDLVELHQLQEVYEERQAVVHGEVLPASLFALQRRETVRVSLCHKDTLFLME